MNFKGLIAPLDGGRSEAGGASRALQRVANRPILSHVLEALHRGGVREVALLAPGPDCAALRECLRTEHPAGNAVQCIPFEPESCGAALDALAAFAGSQACVVHAADGLLSQPLAPLLGRFGEQRRELVALVHHQPLADGSIGLTARRLLRLSDAPAEERAIELAGVCVFGPGALARAIDAGRWRGRELDLVALAEAILQEGGRFGVERICGWCRNSGEVAALLELNRVAFDALARDADADAPAVAGASAAAPGENRVEGYVEVHPSAQLRSSVIVGPATIGPGAEVLDAYIGPYTSIGAGVRVEGAEVERSIILPGASITHIGGRLVGSVVGRDARIFKDFSLPRALRINVGDGGEVALC